MIDKLPRKWTYRNINDSSAILYTVECPGVGQKCTETWIKPATGKTCTMVSTYERLLAMMNSRSCSIVSIVEYQSDVALVDSQFDAYDKAMTVL